MTGPANGRSGDPAPSGWGAGASSLAGARLLRRYPNCGAIMKAAKSRIPGFAFDYLEGGAGDEICIGRNRKTFDNIEIVPRYGIDISRPSTATQLFGRDYAMPLDISPMGLSGLVWPGADTLLAAAAEQARIPFVLSMVSNVSLESIVRAAPNVTWLQLYAVPQDDNRVTFDMVERALGAGVHALVLTLDTPMRQKRLRDTRNGLTVPFRPDLRTALEVATSPAWALAILKHGQPRFANFLPYVSGRRPPGDVAGYVNRHMAGPFTWDLIARIRRTWQGPLVLKGIQHADDDARAVDLGTDGVILSNHGGRQFDTAPAAIDMLQSVKERLAGRIPVNRSDRRPRSTARSIARNAARACAATRLFDWVAPSSLLAATTVADRRARPEPAALTSAPSSGSAWAQPSRCASSPSASQAPTARPNPERSAAIKAPASISTMPAPAASCRRSSARSLTTASSGA
jgi:L-lactate dehydrogenase (cytochrome)